MVVGTGFFGEKLFRSLGARDIEAEGTVPVQSGGFTQLDITDKAAVDYAVSNSLAETVVLAAAVSSVDYCEQHKEETFNVNVNGAKNIAAACRKNNAKLVFLSTDYVFDGAKGNYSETDRTNPLQYYGATKLMAEQEVLKLENSLVLRISSLYGYNSPADRVCFPLFVFNQLKQGKQVEASGQITNPTLIDDAANALLQLCEMDARGIYHAVGSDAVSRFDVAHAVAELFELDAGLIKKTCDLHLLAKRPADSSLSIKKLNSVGIEMQSFASGLAEMKKQMEES